MTPQALSLDINRGGQATGVFELFWRFAAERQNIFIHRLHGKSAPWTQDPVLREYRFTNAYRALDRVSQYLIKEVIYNGDPSPDEVVFRVLLFKLFNKIETWQLLQRRLGELCFKKYRRQDYLGVLNRALTERLAVYSAAYIMAPPSGPFEGLKKHEAHLRLIERMMSDRLPARLERAPSLQGCFQLLAEYPMVGEFLGFQLTIDLNYSDIIDFDEMDFVVAGPGAKSGIVKCFGKATGKSYEAIIREVTVRQDREFEARGISFPGLWGRPLQLIDVQNLFCEIDKYSRVALPGAEGLGSRSRIKRKFSVSAAALPACFFPPKWKLQPMIKQTKEEAAIYIDVVSHDAPLDFDHLQAEQKKHDRACHRDILSMSIQDKLKHFALHYAKYVGKLTACSIDPALEEAEWKRAVVDAFIITLAAANALGVRLQEKTDGRSNANFVAWGRNAAERQVLPGMAVTAGRMAKACEAMDHLESMDYRSEIEHCIVQMAKLLLPRNYAMLIGAVRNRWVEVEARAIKTPL